MFPRANNSVQSSTHPIGRGYCFLDCGFTLRTFGFSFHKSECHVHEIRCRQTMLYWQNEEIGIAQQKVFIDDSTLQKLAFSMFSTRMYFSIKGGGPTC